MFQFILGVVGGVFVDVDLFVWLLVGLCFCVGVCGLWCGVCCVVCGLWCEYVVCGVSVWYVVCMYMYVVHNRIIRTTLRSYT